MLFSFHQRDGDMLSVLLFFVFLLVNVANKSELFRLFRRLFLIERMLHFGNVFILGTRVFILYTGAFIPTRGITQHYIRYAMGKEVFLWLLGLKRGRAE